MCNFLSVILTKESKILYADGYSHENIIDKYKLKDDKYPNKDWIRIEIVDNDVKEDGRAIQYIENPSKEVQLEAVKQYGFAIKYIENPSIEVLEYLRGRNE